jgi:hypothetical protein
MESRTLDERYRRLYEEIGRRIVPAAIRKYIRDSGKKISELVKEEKFAGYLFAKPVIGVSVQLSNQCDKNCKICYLGKKRNDYEMSEDEAKRVRDEILRCNLPNVCLTDCEPFMTPNLMDIFVEESKQFATTIVTNGYPGRKSIKEAREAFKHLRTSGWSFRRIKSDYFGFETYPVLGISCDGFHGKDSLQRTINTLHGLKTAFPKGGHVEIRHTTKNFGKVLNKKDDKFNQMLGAINYSFPFNGNRLDWEDGDLVGETKSFKVSFSPADARYVGNDVSFFPKEEKPKNVQDVVFNPEQREVISIDCHGNVCYGHDLSCASGFEFGNIHEKPLEEMLWEMYKDPLVQAFKVGGVKYLYFVYQQANLQFSASSVEKCDLCAKLRTDKDNRERAREFLKEKMHENPFFVFHNYVDNLARLYK